MKQSQERFNYLMETRDEQRMILYLQHDSLTPDEKEATEAIVADLEAELEEYGLVFEKNQQEILKGGSEACPKGKRRSSQVSVSGSSLAVGLSEPPLLP